MQRSGVKCGLEDNRAASISGEATRLGSSKVKHEAHVSGPTNGKELLVDFDKVEDKMVHIPTIGTQIVYSNSGNKGDCGLGLEINRDRPRKGDKGPPNNKRGEPNSKGCVEPTNNGSQTHMRNTPGNKEKDTQEPNSQEKIQQNNNM